MLSSSQAAAFIIGRRVLAARGGCGRSRGLVTVEPQESVYLPCLRNSRRRMVRPVAAGPAPPPKCHRHFYLDPGLAAVTPESLKRRIARPLEKIPRPDLITDRQPR